LLSATVGSPHWVAFLDDSIELRPPGASETQGRILDAARRLARRHGMSRLRMTDVAAAARVSRAWLYRYYPDRDRLVEALIDWGILRYADDLHEAVASVSGLEDQVFSAALVHRASWDADQDYGQDWDRPYRDRVITRQADKVFPLIMDALQPALARARLKGSVRKNIDIEQASEWLARVIHSMAVTPGITFDARDRSAISSFLRNFAIAGLD
jgi:AcrR family transcriptional regulator